MINAPELDEAISSIERFCFCWRIFKLALEVA